MASVGQITPPRAGIAGKLKYRSMRRIKEMITAYIFLLPALIIIGTFGLFPMLFSVYVSLHRWRIVPGKYLGLDHYVRGLDNLAYVLGFWLVVILIYSAIQSLIKLNNSAKEHSESTWVWIVPSLVTSVGIFQFLRFAVLLLPEVLDIAEQVKGMERTQALFVGLLREAWRVPQVVSARQLTMLILIAGFTLAYAFTHFVSRTPRASNYYVTFITVFILLGVAAALGWLTWTEIQLAYAEALGEGEQLEIWSQVVTISAGIVMLILSWKLWSGAKHRSANWVTLFRLLGAVALLIGAWVLIAELPRVVQSGYEDWWRGLQVTVYYALFTVPVQLSLALFMAVLLFQDIKAKGLFRLVYFLPYITSPVAAAGIFRVLFSGRPTGPINNLLALFGADTLLWLDEPKGIFQMLVGSTLDIPQWLEGPSLALVVIIIFNVWNFFGYNAVVFLAGLGSISRELYEAASIDGAGRAAQFRHITIPLLSPTIYFLTLIAVIGTFKAFTHVWVLRSGAALGTTDTASIVIFNEFNRNTRYGYASSLALVLLGLVFVLTLINNRIAEEKVFYG